MKYLVLDGVALVAVCMIGWGISMLSPAAFWIAAGGTLLAVVICVVKLFTDRPLTPVLLLLAIGSSAAAAAAGEIYVPQSPEPIPDVRDGNRLIVRHNCTISLNPKTKLADWVLYRVDRRLFEGERVASPARNWWAQFPADTIPSKSYDGTPYARGHLAPLASFAGSGQAWELNGMENIAPQTEQLNAGPWLRLENWERKQAEGGEIVIVLTGPLYADDTTKSRVGGTRVPSHFWKVVSLGKAAKRRAWLFPQEPDKKEFEAFELSPAELKMKAGVGW